MRGQQRIPLPDFHDLTHEPKTSPGKLTYASTGNFDASVVFPVKILLNLADSSRMQQ